MTQGEAPLRLQREVLEGPAGSSWRAQQVSYLLTPTMEGVFKLREATEPWKAGDTSAHGRKGLGGDGLVMPLLRL